MCTDIYWREMDHVIQWYTYGKGIIYVYWYILTWNGLCDTVICTYGKGTLVFIDIYTCTDWIIRTNSYVYWYILTRNGLCDTVIYIKKRDHICVLIYTNVKWTLWYSDMYIRKRDLSVYGHMYVHWLNYTYELICVLIYTHEKWTMWYSDIHKEKGSYMCTDIYLREMDYGWFQAWLVGSIKL